MALASILWPPMPKRSQSFEEVTFGLKLACLYSRGDIGRAYIHKTGIIDEAQGEVHGKFDVIPYALEIVHVTLVLLSDVSRHNFYLRYSPTYRVKVQVGHADYSIHVVCV